MAGPLLPFAPEIVQRLEAYGEFSLHRPSLLGRWIGIPAEVAWEHPAGLENDLAPLTVALWFSPGKTGGAEVARLLDELDAFRSELPARIEDLKSQIVGEFRQWWEPDLPAVERQRLCGDAAAAIADGAILGEVTAVHLRFDATGKWTVRSVLVVSQWSEDGFTFEWLPRGAS